MMMSAASLPPLLVFSGLVQIGWVLRLGGGTLMWYYLAIYYLGLLAVIVYQRERTVPFALALLNAGGIPPMTGFMIKLRALGALPAMSGVVLLTARGAALTSYVRDQTAGVGRITRYEWGGAANGERGSADQLRS